MSVFGSLKTTLKHISAEMSELKKVQTDFLFKSEILDPAPNIQSLELDEIEKKISEAKSLLKNVRVATSKVEVNFKNKQGNTKSYCYDIEDLFLDLNSEYISVEKRLVQFGYCPPKIGSPCEDNTEKLPSNSAPNDQIDSQQVTKSITPKLLRQKSGSNLLNSTSDIYLKLENKNKTPVLCLDGGNKLFTKPVSSQLVLPKSKAASYGEVARRLDFE